MPESGRAPSTISVMLVIVTCAKAAVVKDSVAAVDNRVPTMICRCKRGPKLQKKLLVTIPLVIIPDGRQPIVFSKFRKLECKLPKILIEINKLVFSRCQRLYPRSLGLER